MKAMYAVIGIIVGLVIGISIPRPVRVVEIEKPVEVPMSMNNTMHSMNASLSGKTGNAFDQAFLEEMIVHHEGALAMAQQVQVSSARPDLQAFAKQIITAQEGEIAQMKAWLKEWF